MLLWYFNSGGKAANPAAPKATRTHIMDRTSSKEVRISQLRMSLTSLAMKALGRAGSTARAPHTTVATAKKKERLLKIQKMRTLT
ncbi:hypothetical protein Mapa_017362 [Marchantia paleacea]|nr:hypothetical protein Mapa_017362 [Marchantia paleacea]